MVNDAEAGLFMETWGLTALLLSSGICAVFIYRANREKKYRNVALGLVLVVALFILCAAIANLIIQDLPRIEASP